MKLTRLPRLKMLYCSATSERLYNARCVETLVTYDTRIRGRKLIRQMSLLHVKEPDRKIDEIFKVCSLRVGRVGN